MHYHPHTPADTERALKKVGVGSIEELFADLPAELKDVAIDLADGVGEAELLSSIRALAAKNRPARADFLGGGQRRHFIPSVTPHLAMQSEFVTAYTPYQPEVAQGILQATFEYQTMMTELTGLDVSNASMYDGASAAAEAALLAVRQTGRGRVAVSRGVHPETREVLATYLGPIDIEIVTLDLDELTTSAAGLPADVACLLVQQPNHLGYLEPMRELSDAAHAAGSLFVAVVDPLSLAVLAPPGEYGADVAVGDGQTLGNYVNFGGPSFGFMVVKENLIRQFPGRLVGETVDVDGRRSFVLTLQAREQHIRRSKAKSNICSNHQLTALMAAVNISALGAPGLREMAVASVKNAHKLADALAAAGARPVTTPKFFQEFALRVQGDPAAIRSELARRGIDAGIPIGEEYGLGNAVTLSCTELTDDAQIDALVGALADIGEAREGVGSARD